jgi:hypothetical protein
VKTEAETSVADKRKRLANEFGRENTGSGSGEIVHRA